MKLASLSIVIAMSGCSLAFPLDEYDQGSTGAGLTPTTGGAGGGEVGGGAPVCEGGPNPPLSDVVSDFDRGVGDGLYLLNCAQIVDGEVHSNPMVLQEYCWVATEGVRRLACDSVMVRVLNDGLADGGVHRFMYVRQNDGPGFANVLQEGDSFGGEFTFTDPTFDLEADAWWQVSADETTVTFSTSPDGVTWKAKGTVVPAFPLDNINIAVGSGMWQTAPNPVTDRFDCFNVGPPCGDSQ